MHQRRFPPLSPSKDLADYVVLSGKISRWLWRIYAQRLTAAGRSFLLITLVFVVYGGASLQLQGYVLACYSGVAWIIAFAAMLIYRPRVSLRVAHADRVGAGELVQVDLDVQQQGWLRGADLSVVAHRLPPSIDSIPDPGIDVPDLKVGERARVQLQLRCNRRGPYVLHGFRVESGFPFGILKSRRIFRTESRIVVYPAFRVLSRVDLPAGRRYQPGGVMMTSQLGDSFEYLGNREFRDGDNLRDIDWRSTARASKLIVREWVEEYMLRAAVILDTQIPPKLSSRSAAAMRESLERAVALSASVSDYMARQDYLVDIFSAGPNLYHLTAGRSLAYLDQILDILACVEESAQEPFDIIEPQLATMLDKISTAVCLFLDWNPARRDFVERLQTHGLAVKVIVLCDGKCTLPTTGTDAGSAPLTVLSGRDVDRGIDEL